MSKLTSENSMCTNFNVLLSFATAIILPGIILSFSSNKSYNPSISKSFVTSDPVSCPDSATIGFSLSDSIFVILKKISTKN